LVAKLELRLIDRPRAVHELNSVKAATYRLVRLPALLGCRASTVGY
jgi:hypothetical protein